MVKARDFKFFKDIDDDNPLQNLKYVKEEYKAGEVVINANNPIHSIGFIIEGFLEALNYTYNGEKVTSNYFSTNEIFPEYLYFSGEKEYPYTLVSLENSTIAWVEINDFENAIHNSKKAMRALVEYLAKRGLYNQLMLSCLNYKKIRQRLAYWLLYVKGLNEGNKIYIYDTQTILANRLHVSRSTLNQELKFLENEGYFTVNKHVIKILNKEGLEKLI